MRKRNHMCRSCDWWQSAEDVPAVKACMLPEGASIREIGFCDWHPPVQYRSAVGTRFVVWADVPSDCSAWKRRRR